MSAVHGVPMADVAAREGFKPTFGQSRSLSRGELRLKGSCSVAAVNNSFGPSSRRTSFPKAPQVSNFRIRMNGGPLRDLETSIAKTSDLLRRLAETKPGSVPAIVAGATVRIPRGVMLPEALLILDALAIRTDGDLPELIVGEVKTYPDRGGHTDPHELAVARAQAGLYVHALQLVVRELRVEGRVRVRTDGFLALTRPGSNMPAIRAGEDLRFQAERARRGFDLLEKAALGLPPFDPVGDDPLASVIQAPTDYSEACLSFCDRAEKCHSFALDTGDAAVLGDDVVRFLGDISFNSSSRANERCRACRRRRSGSGSAHPRGKLDGGALNARDVVQRLRAFDLGRPLFRGETRHFASAEGADNLVVAFVRMGGESRPWGIAFGHPGGAPTVLTVPEGRNRDLVADMCAEFAPILLKHLRTPNYVADAPTNWEELRPFRQIWLPNVSHLDMLHHLAYAYTFTKWGAGKRGRLNAFGRACGWLFREAQRPGQQHVMVATQALKEFFVFPAQDVRQGHLGFLLAWLNPDVDRNARMKSAIEAERHSVSASLDPDLERITEPLLESWLEARRAANEAEMDAAAVKLKARLIPELVRRYDLCTDAISILTRDERRVNAGVPTLVQEGLKEQWFQHTRQEAQIERRGRSGRTGFRRLPGDGSIARRGGLAVPGPSSIVRLGGEPVAARRRGVAGGSDRGGRGLPRYDRGGLGRSHGPREQARVASYRPDRWPLALTARITYLHCWYVETHRGNQGDRRPPRRRAGV